MYLCLYTPNKARRHNLQKTILKKNNTTQVHVISFLALAWMILAKEKQNNAFTLVHGIVLECLVWFDYVKLRRFVLHRTCRFCHNKISKEICLPSLLAVLQFIRSKVFSLEKGDIFV